MLMWTQDMVKRIMEEYALVVFKDMTVRQVAEIIGVSKSTVSKDLHERLKKIDPIMHKKVQSVLDLHYNIKHIRGGEATRLMFLGKRGI